MGSGGPKIQCTKCGDIIQSMHRHDFVTCSCFDNNGNGIFIDGGSIYTRIGGTTWKYPNLSQNSKD